MTLGEFFTLIGENPSFILFYFGLLPFIALLTNFMGKDEGNLSPWKFLYSAILFLVAVPGIMAVALNVYLFLFEKRSIFSTDIFTQIVPIISMATTLLIIRKNADFSEIPGANQLSAFVTMITCILIFMFILDRTHFIVFMNMPFQTAIIVFIVLFVLIRVSWSRIFSK
jgi:hypothetical protein